MKWGQVPAWVWTVLVVVHGVAFLWAIRADGWSFPDSGRYVQAAQNMVAHGELYARPWPDRLPEGQQVQEYTIRPPAYPAVLAWLKGGMKSPWLVLLFQNVLSVLAVGGVLGWWAARARRGLAQWVGALGLSLTFPAQVIYANAVMSETLLQAALLGMVVAAIRFRESRDLKYWGMMAALVMLALLLKPVCCLLAGLLAAVGVGLAWRARRAALAWVGMLPLLVMSGYMAWNQQRTGYFHFSSIAEINLLHYNAAGVVRQLEGPAAEEYWVASVLREADHQPTFAARQQLIQQRATQVLLAHPLVYAGQHLLGMGTLVLDPGRFDISEFLKVAPPAGGGLLAQIRAGGLWRALGQLPLKMVALLALVMLSNIGRLLLAWRGFRRLGRDARSREYYGRWIALGLIGYIALLTGPLGAARFLVPVWPLLLGLALAGIGEPATPSASPEEAAASR